MLEARVNTLYAAMFDEVDEGTALFLVETRMDKLPAGANMVFLNVMAGAAYGIAVAMFILAACSSLRPAKYDNAVAFVTQVTNMFDRGASHASSTDKKKPKNPKDKDDGPANRR